MNQRDGFHHWLWTTLCGLMVVAMLLSVVPPVPVEAATVKLCFNKTLNGTNIQGLLNGTAKNVWAGVFEVTLESVLQHAFCTDIQNGISGGCYDNSQLGVTAPKVACTLQYYPPDTGVSNDEAAARQAAVWYFSDNYVTTGPAGIKTRSDAIIQDIEAKYASGACSTVVNPTLSITPTTAVNFLADNGAGGYYPSGHDFTVTLLRGTTPLVNQAVAIAATNGATINGGASPQTLNTDVNGQATFTLSHQIETTSEVTASALVSLPVGTRVDPGTNKQKIVLTGTQNFTVTAKASKTWQAGSKLIIKKFHDRNRNGLKDNENEEWLAWTVYVREHQANQTLPPSAGWDAYTTTTVEASPLTLGVDPSKTYDICESVADANWEATPAGSGKTCEWDVTPAASIVFSNVKKPALLILKFQDTNGNGAWDAGEPGQDGVGFQVKRWTSDGWSSTWSGQTANGGILGWSNIDFNRYQITEVVPDGWYMSGPAVQAVELDVNAYQLYSVTFGNIQPGSFAVNKAWYIAGALGTAPAGGAEVCLQRQGVAPAAASAVTPKDGAGQLLALDATYGYCQPLTSSAAFTNLWPGSYTLQEKPLAGWTIPAPQTVVINSGSNNLQAPLTLRNDRVLGALTINKQLDFSKLPQGTDLETIGAASAAFNICILGPSFPSTPDCKTFDGSETPAWTQTWTGLIPGEYTVSESGAGNSWVVSLPNQGKVEVLASQEATPYQVSNEYQPASLKVSKSVIWNGAPDLTASFNICIQGPAVDGIFPEARDCKPVNYQGGDLIWSPLAPGNYRVSEPDVDLELWTVTISGSPVTVPAGGQGLAAVENKEIPKVPPVLLGSLQVTKVVEWATATQDTQKTFEICVEGPTEEPVPLAKFSSCKTIGYTGGILTWEGLEPGTYTVTETDPGTNEWVVTITGSPVTVPAGGLGKAEVRNKEIPKVPPTAVTLEYFKVKQVAGKQVTLTWATAMEKDNLGFYLYRSTSNDFAQAVQLPIFVPSLASGSGHTVYQFADTVEKSGRYYYWLVDLEAGNKLNTNAGRYSTSALAGGETVFLPAITR